MDLATDDRSDAPTGRLSPLRRKDLDEGGRRLWDGITGSRGAQLVGAEGALIGPFNAFVHAPDTGAKLGALGTVLRFGTSLERRLTEIAIITVGARWRAEFEWWAHARMARQHGVTDQVVEAIGRGEQPEFDQPDAGAVYAAAYRLSRYGTLDRATYDTAHEFLGDTGMVELVALCGYYTLICTLLNTFEVPLPPGETPTWGDHG